MKAKGEEIAKFKKHLEKKEGLTESGRAKERREENIAGEDCRKQKKSTATRFSLLHCNI